MLLLHGWPGCWYDWRAVIGRLSGEHRVLAPDFRGFNETDLPAGRPADVTGELHLADDVIRLLGELTEGTRTVIVGTDIGAAVAQRVARQRPDLVRALVLVNPTHPGITQRQRDQLTLSGELWYQDFHQLSLAPRLVRDRESVADYLRHFLDHWSGDWQVNDADLEVLVGIYARPRALERSVAWYQARKLERPRLAASLDSAGPLATRTYILWGARDPVSPLRWSDNLARAFSDHELEVLPNVGHFAPVEAPERVVSAVDRCHS